ncbi:MAG: hypothetical protein OXD43_03310 [Bacteroidetes bacterium]|nr:hypothetical protein [Bacteroidota bacterium]
MLYQVQGTSYLLGPFEEAPLDLGIQVLTGYVNSRYPNGKKDYSFTPRTMSFIQPIYNIRNGTKKHGSHQTQSPSYTPALNFFGYRDVQKNGCGYHLSQWRKPATIGLCYNRHQGRASTPKG